jgi:predicted amidophosphoribosyltransferase
MHTRSILPGVVVAAEAAEVASAMPVMRQVRRALAELAGLVLPVDCAGCGLPGTALCGGCRSAFAAPAQAVLLTGWPSAPPAAAAAVYARRARRVVVEWKDRGRHDLTGVLGTALARAVAALPDRAADPPVGGLQAGAQGIVTGAAPHLPGAVPARPVRSPTVTLVPVPSSRAARRRRGEHLVARLAVEAARQLRRAGGDVRVLPALRLVRPVADQAGLGRSGRRANLDHAMRLAPSAAVAVLGRRCVIVDDVLTTGVTVREASRVLSEAGAWPAGVAACCATPLLRGLSGGLHLH